MICKKKGILRFLLFFLLIMMICLPAVGAQADVFDDAKAVSGGKWVTKGENLLYCMADGSYARNTWLKIDGKVYYFKNRYCQKGWFEYKDQTYYADKNGRVLKNHWIQEQGNRYYVKNTGARCQDTWRIIKGKYYYFHPSGKMAASQFVGDYYVAKSGVRLTSTWLMLKNGDKYYLGANGKMLKKIWLKSGGRLYYLKANGKMAVSEWLNLSSGIYYVNAKGARLANCVVDDYYLDRTGKRLIKVFKGDYIFVGDSRFVGMEMAVGSSEDALYIAKVAMGYDWLNKEAGPLLKKNLTANPNVKVILGLGINDLGNVGRYITYYKELISSFPETKFYCLSVNPLVESRWPTVKNATIRSFNARIKASVPAKYINCYDSLIKKGFRTVDGLHYTTLTYQYINSFIRKKAK